MHREPYTTVVFSAKKRTGLPFTQFAFCDVVYNLSNNSSGWCYANRSHLAEQFDVNERTVYRWIEYLAEKGWLTKDPETGYIKTTSKWYQSVVGPDTPSDKMPTPHGKMSDVYKEETNNNKIIKTKDLPISTKDVEIGPEQDENLNDPLTETDKAKPKGKNWVDPSGPARWYEEVFAPLYREHAGQPALFGNVEGGIAKKVFAKIKKLCPDFSPEEIYERAGEIAFLVYTSEEFAWMDSPPNIREFQAQVEKANYHANKLLNMTEEEIFEQQKSLEDLEDFITFAEEQTEKLNEQTTGKTTESNRLSNPSSKHKQSAGGSEENVYGLY